MDNTTICTHCQALAIDSRDHDLQDTTSENGRIVLESPWSIPLKYKRRDTYPDLPALKASADHGCAMCGLLRKHIIDSYSSKFVEILSQITENDGCITLYDFTYMRYDYDELNKGPAGFSHLSGSLDVQYGELSDLVYMSTHWPIQFSIAAAEGDPIRNYLGISRRPLDSFVLSEQNVQLLRHWIDECERTDENCQVETDSFVPTRLLYVGNEERDEDKVRLIITASDSMLPPAVKYAALSYCWGDTSKYLPLETTEAKLSARLQGIRRSEIPRTIHDAIIVTRKLGLQYLWVDALCIIQGLQEDWQKEAATMTDIYNNAYVTIAAVASTSSHSGFLSTDRRALQAYIPSQSSSKLSLHGTLCISPSKYSYVLSNFEEDVDMSLWNKRAWTFQEQAISRRVLYLGKRMYFQCRERFRNEDIVQNSSPRLLNIAHAVGSQKLDDECRQALGLNTEMSPNLCKSWRNAVGTYCGRILTFDDDRLPAISGLAHHVARVCKDDYLAGLWKRDLLLGLLWKAAPGAKRATTYLAPSWSWASCGSTELWWLTYADEARRIKEESTIVETCIIPDGPDNMGRIRGGYVTLRGKLEWLDSAISSELEPFLFWDTEEDIPNKEPVCALLLARILSGLNASISKDVVLDGMLLRKVEHESHRNCFRRVGVFEVVSRPELLTAFKDCAVETVTII